MKRVQRQHGFTLVEIAVVLVIIGLLLGGVLKGQELIASARVRNLADQQAGIQAAYFGFIDRYRAVPGDMPAADATNAIGQTVNTGGNGDGRLSAPGDTAPEGWNELNAVWEQLSKAGFIKGNYEGSGSAPTSSDAPVNVFNGVVVLGRHDGYMDTGTPTERLLLTMGQNVPVDIARELDTKLDDGQPLTGSLRNAAEAATPAVHQSGNATSCVNTTPDPDIWDIAADGQNCNPAFIF